MPQVKDAPKKLNDLLEEVYNKCIKSGKRKDVCAASAWSAVQGAGWFKGKDEKWHRKIKLTKEWTDFLLTYPETGMGYQKVDLILKNGQKLKNLFVYNAEILELPLGSVYLEIDDIKAITISKEV